MGKRHFEIFKHLRSLGLTDSHSASDSGTHSPATSHRILNPDWHRDWTCDSEYHISKYANNDTRRLAHLDEFHHSSPVPLTLFLMIFFILGVVWLRFARSSAEP